MTGARFVNESLLVDAAHRGRARAKVIVAVTLILPVESSDGLLRSDCSAARILDDF